MNTHVAARGNQKRNNGDHKTEINIAVKIGAVNSIML